MFGVGCWMSCCVVSGLLAILKSTTSHQQASAFQEDPVPRVMPAPRTVKEEKYGIGTKAQTRSFLVSSMLF